MKANKLAFFLICVLLCGCSSRIVSQDKNMVYQEQLKADSLALRNMIAEVVNNLRIDNEEITNVAIPQDSLPAIIIQRHKKQHITIHNKEHITQRDTIVLTKRDTTYIAEKTKEVTTQKPPQFLSFKTGLIIIIIALATIVILINLIRK